MKTQSASKITGVDLQKKLGFKLKMISNSPDKTFAQDYFETSYYSDQEQGRHFWVALNFNSLSTSISLKGDRLLRFKFR